MISKHDNVFFEGFHIHKKFCTRAVFMKMKYKFVVICFNIVVFWKYLFIWSVLSFFVLSRELVFLDTVPSQKAHTLYLRFFSNRVFGIAPKNYNFFKSLIMISKKFLMEIKIKACYHIDFETAPSKGDFLLGP